MQPRETIAWIVATCALFGCAFLTADRRPKWEILNTASGVVRMDPRTGETHKLARDNWRDVSAVRSQAEAFDPDAYLAAPPAKN